MKGTKKQNQGYTIRCGGHNYVTLEWNGEFLHCYDNTMEYMDRIIEKIEKRTGMKFEDIPIKGQHEDFNGLRFVGKGFQDDWTKNLIYKKEGANQ